VEKRVPFYAVVVYPYLVKMLGTRLWASAEALTPEAHTNKAMTVNDDSTIRTRALVAEAIFNAGVKNKLLAQWANREEEVPRWVVILGLVLAVLGELSWLDVLFPKALSLIPLTRFPGFVWMIVTGFALPSARELAKVPQE
jgi:hypothetical protein